MTADGLGEAGTEGGSTLGGVHSGQSCASIASIAPVPPIGAEATTLTWPFAPHTTCSPAGCSSGAAQAQPQAISTQAITQRRSEAARRQCSKVVVDTKA